MALSKSACPRFYPASQNRYSYAENNPVTYNDPSGMCVPQLAGAIANVGIGYRNALGH